MDLTQYKAINGTVFVVDDVREELSEGGIVLVEDSQLEKVMSGTVIDVSPFLLENGELKDPHFGKGDKVLYGQHTGAGQVWKEKDGKTYRLAKWNEIMAVKT